jgi:hypothetical protein
VKVDFNDMTVGGFAYELYRGLSTQYADAAELGECMDTIGRVKNGDFDSWVSEWSATADRVSACR